MADEFPIIVVANGLDDQEALNAYDIETGADEEADLDGEIFLGVSWPIPLFKLGNGRIPPFIEDEATPTDINEPYLT